MMTPWAWTAVGLLVLSFVLDSLLAKRYAGGSSERDRGTWKLLFVTLGANLTLLFVLSAFDIGRSQTAAEWLGPFGVSAAALGMVVRYSAIFTLGDRFTWRVVVQDSHRLARNGIFAWVRHPGYAGGLLGVVGLILAFGSWMVGLVFCLSYLPLMLYRIKVEEHALLDHFGHDYADYQQRTRRLIPGVY